MAEELVRHREFVNKAKALFNSSIPEIKASVTKFDPDVVAKGLSHHFDSFLKEAKAEIVATKDLTIGDVFDKYDDGERGLAQRGIGVLQRFGPRRVPVTVRVEGKSSPLAAAPPQ